MAHIGAVFFTVLLKLNLSPGFLSYTSQQEADMKYPLQKGSLCLLGKWDYFTEILNTCISDVWMMRCMRKQGIVSIIELNRLGWNFSSCTSSLVIRSANPQWGSCYWNIKLRVSGSRINPFITALLDRKSGYASPLLVKCYWAGKKRKKKRKRKYLGCLCFHWILIFYSFSEYEYSEEEDKRDF